MIDALLLAVAKIRRTPPLVPELSKILQSRRRMVLITGHRRESFGTGFESLCLGIVDLAQRFPEVDFVYPVHLNPNVREPVIRILRGAGDNVHLIEPVPYLPFVFLMDRSTFILTDSGGIQEEAPSLGKPILVMRDTTERPEAAKVGTVKLVGTDRRTIFTEGERLLTDATTYGEMSRAHNPYGDGESAPRISDICARFLDRLE